MSTNNMKITRQTAPYIRKEVSVNRMMTDVIIALIPVILFSLIKFKLDYLTVMITSLTTILIWELIFFKITKRDITKGQIKAGIITALIYGLIIPSTTSVYITFVGATFGILFGKLVFGGLGSNIGNPAAIGRLVITIAFGSSLVYVDAGSAATPLTLGKGLGDALSTSFNDAMATYSFMDLFLGRIPGSSGEICSLAILIGAVYLIARKSADIRPMLATIVTFFLIVFIAGIRLDVVAWQFALFHTLSGGLLFGAVFMVTDPVTSPVTGRGRITYGFLIGIITAFIRLFGAYPEGMAFAILIMNMFTPAIDYYKWSSNKYTSKYIIGILIAFVSFSTIAFIGVGGII